MLLEHYPCYVFLPSWDDTVQVDYYVPLYLFFLIHSKPSWYLYFTAVGLQHSPDCLWYTVVIQFIYAVSAGPACADRLNQKFHELSGLMSRGDENFFCVFPTTLRRYFMIILIIAHQNWASRIVKKRTLEQIS